jgi:hypothetical protein
VHDLELSSVHPRHQHASAQSSTIAKPSLDFVFLQGICYVLGFPDTRLLPCLTLDPINKDRRRIQRVLDQRNAVLANVRCECKIQEF